MNDIDFNNYPNDPEFGRTFAEVRDFLSRINERSLASVDFPWGRWEWAFSLPFLPVKRLTKMGIWSHGGKIVALTSYESTAWDVYYAIDPDYAFLKEQVLEHIHRKMQGPEGVRVPIPDNDREAKMIAEKIGFVPGKAKEYNAVIDIDDQFVCELPRGFSTTNLEERFDLCEYNRILHRGFNHPGPETNSYENIASRLKSLSGPDVILKLNTAVVSPERHFVSYCGIWYKPGTKYALVEPVATDPEYRQMGLGKAAVLSALAKCGQLGAAKAFVGSRQDFYYHIGFMPYSESTFWEYPDKSTQNG